jgi:hypothetical protein
MSRLLTFALTLICLTAAALWQPPTVAYACSCLAPPPPETARDQSAAVFSGTVVAIAGSGAAPGSPLLVTFDLQQVWKGPDGPQLTITTPADSAGCGYAFAQGEAYLVYAGAEGGRLSTGLCTRTAPLDAADADLAALGQGTPAAAGTGDVSNVRMDVPWLPIILGGIALLIGLALFLPSLTRRRRA